MTSLAITDSAAPTRSAACSPRIRVRPNAGAGRLERIEAAGEERADRAGEDVAGAGGRQRRRRDHADRDGSPGAATIVSSPFRTTTHRPPSAASRAEARRCAPISSESLSSRRPSSPACGVITVGLANARRGVEGARVGVQPVGVDHEREPGAGGDARARRRARRPSGRAQGRARAPPPSRTRPGSRPQRPRRSAPSAEAQPRHITSVSFASKIASSSPGRRRSRSPRRRGSRRSQKGQTEPVSPRDPPATTTCPEVNLVESGPRRGSSSQTRAVIAPPGGSSRAPAGMPMSATRSSPVARLPGAMRCRASPHGR